MTGLAYYHSSDDVQMKPVPGLPLVPGVDYSRHIEGEDCARVSVIDDLWH